MAVLAVATGNERQVLTFPPGTAKVAVRLLADLLRCRSTCMLTHRKPIGP